MIAISTAYKRALIGYDINGKRGSVELDANHSHSENLLFSLDKMLEEAGLTLKDNNDGFALVIGPGSFTGIRISMALVKGLVAGGSADGVIPITTFDLMAKSYLKIQPKRDFICIINALSGLYYVCPYNIKGEKLGDERVVSREELTTLQNYDFVGLEEEGLCEIRVQPTGEDLLALAKGEKRVNARNLTPLYLRKSQAEDDLEKKLKKS